VVSLGNVLRCLCDVCAIILQLGSSGSFFGGMTLPVCGRSDFWDCPEASLFKRLQFKKNLLLEIALGSTYPQSGELAEAENHFQTAIAQPISVICKLGAYNNWGSLKMEQNNPSAGWLK
jgi:hypothetical protein